MLKKGYYSFEFECVEQISISLDNTTADINDLLSEMDPKINDIKDNTKYLTEDPEKVLNEKKEQKVQRKSYQLLKELIE